MEEYRVIVIGDHRENQANEWEDSYVYEQENWDNSNCYDQPHPQAQPWGWGSDDKAARGNSSWVHNNQEFSDQPYEQFQPCSYQFQESQPWENCNTAEVSRVDLRELWSSNKDI